MQRSMDSGEGSPHLDIYNFEEALAENSKYILTSPRSLEACARFGIKPVELLHKPLSEFEDEYINKYGTNPSQAALRQMYQEHERQRLRKLKVCREERDRIIKDPSKQLKSQGRNETYSFKNTEGENGIKSTSKYKSTREPKECAPRWTDILRNEASDEEFEDDKDSDQEKDYPRRHNKYSSMTEFLRNGSPIKDNSVMELFESPVRERSYPKSNGSKSNEGNRDTKFTDGNVTGSLTRIARQTYGETTHNSDNIFEERTENQEADTRVTDYQSSFQSRSRNAWQNTDVNQTPNETFVRRPSSSSTGSGNRTRKQKSMSVDNLKTSLPQHIAKGAAKLSQKDQRLLSIMVAKANEEDMEKRIRRSSELDWLDKRKLENEIRKTRAKQQHMLLADKLRENEMTKESMAKQRKRAEEEDRLIKESFTESKSNQWKQERMLQAQMKNNKTLLKKMQEEENKRKQEENLLRAEEEKQLMRNAAHMSLGDRHEQAIRNKEIQESEERAKRLDRNMEKKQRHELRMETVKRQMSEDEAIARASIEGKFSQETFQKLKNKREMEITLNRDKTLERKGRQEEYLTRMQNDSEKWQNELKHFQDTTEGRADQARKRNTMMKAQKAHEQRLQKEELHAWNKAKADDDERLRQQEFQKYLSLKDERRKMIIEEKDEVTRANQEGARASRAMRDMIKEQTVKSSFDRMAEEAKRMARIERKGFQTYKKNISSFKLG